MQLYFSDFFFPRPSILADETQTLSCLLTQVLSLTIAGLILAGLMRYFRMPGVDTGTVRAQYPKPAVPRRITAGDKAWIGVMVAAALFAGHRELLSDLAHFRRGSAFYHRAEYDNAIRSYSRALEINPRFAAALGQRANCHFSMGKYALAAEDYGRAIALDSNDLEACKGLVDAYQKLGRYREGLAACDKALAMDPEDAESYHDRAVMHFHLENYTKARFDLRKCVELGGKANPAFVEALKTRGPAAKD